MLQAQDISQEAEHINNINAEDGNWEAMEESTPTKIMEELYITNNTLKFHNKNLYAKLGMKNRKELVEIGKLVKEK